MAARLLDYYFEQFDEENVIRQIRQIFQVKERQIADMERFVRSEDCLREKLLSYFGEKSATTFDCCSQCQNIADEWLVRTTVEQKRSTKLDWKERLHQLLG